MKEKQLTINQDPRVKSKFQSYPEEVKTKLNRLRSLIIETATAIDTIREIEETLKWGEPAYLTAATKSGSTLRLGWKDADCVLYLHCRTNLVDRARDRFPDSFSYIGNRAIHTPGTGPFDREAFGIIVGMALTYHRTKTR